MATLALSINNKEIIPLSSFSVTFKNGNNIVTDCIRPINNNLSTQSVVQTINITPQVTIETSTVKPMSIIQIGDYQRHNFVYINLLYNSTPIAAIPVYLLINLV